MPLYKAFSLLIGCVGPAFQELPENLSLIKNIHSRLNRDSLADEPTGLP